MDNKYYKLEELKEGMEVSVRSLDQIVGTKILLDANTIRIDEMGEVRGTILAIGKEYSDIGLTVSDVATVYNFIDETRDDVSMDE